MSYDIAVWESDRPSDDAEALKVYEAMWEKYEDAAPPPSPAILEYARALTAKYPDLDDLSDDEVDTSPWADSPLEGNIMGPFFYFAMTYSGAERALPFVAETARARGLVCFDPQEQRLI